MGRHKNRIQNSIILEFMEKYPDIAKGIPKRDKQIVNSLWNGLAESLNAAGPPIKDVGGWRKIWTEWKSEVKKKLAHSKIEEEPAVSNPFLKLQLTEAEKTIARICGTAQLVAGFVDASNSATSLDDNACDESNNDGCGTSSKRANVAVQRSEDFLNAYNNILKELIVKIDKLIEISKEKSDSLELKNGAIEKNNESVVKSVTNLKDQFMMHNKISDNPDETVASNETYNMLRFLEPVLRLEPRQPRNNTVSNISENSINMASAEEFSDDHKENIEILMPAQNSNKRPRFDEQEENYNSIHVVNSAASTCEMPIKSDIWDTVGKFVALNGREWAKENHKLANQFKAAIYKLLADFQEKASDTDDSKQMAQISSEQNQHRNTDETITIQNRLSNIETRLTTIEQECKTHSESFRAQSVLFDKVLNHSKRSDQLIEQQFKELQTPSNSTSNASPEIFNDLAQLKIKSTDELKQFETNLENDEYRERFIRYLNFKFTINGYQNGASFFVELFRLLVDNSMLKPYSWAGISRNGKKHISFQQEHKTFVKHMINFVIMADKTQNESRVTKYFANALRYKNVNEKREADRTSATKRFGPRIKSRRIDITEQQTTDQAGDDQNLTNENINFEIKVEPNDCDNGSAIFPADDMKRSNENNIDESEDENYSYFEEDEEELEDDELIEDDDYR